MGTTGCVSFGFQEKGVFVIDNEDRDLLRGSGNGGRHGRRRRRLHDGRRHHRDHLRTCRLSAACWKRSRARGIPSIPPRSRWSPNSYVTLTGPRGPDQDDGAAAGKAGGKRRRPERLAQLGTGRRGRGVRTGYTARLRYNPNSARNPLTNPTGLC